MTDDLTAVMAVQDTVSGLWKKVVIPREILTSHKNPNALQFTQNSLDIWVSPIYI